MPLPDRLILLFDHSSRPTLSVPLSPRLLVGRSDPDTAIADVAVDLAAYNGETRGVSRNHAVLICRDDAVYLQDLGSLNGTRINGLRLAENREYRLRDGDELEFGQVRCVVHLA